MSWSDLATKGRVLVVDDAAENIRVLHSALKDEHDILFALDGHKAMEIAREQVPDLILLDAVMPDPDGYKVCAELKAGPRTKDIPVLFVTALNSDADETRALEAGAVDFIVKPVNAAVVRARVRTHLTLKRQRDLLKELAMSDGLTGVANRRCFDDTFEREWRRCERAHQPVSIIMADVDHFKRFNDIYGHQAGDACLTAVAQALSQCVRRPPDLVARYGGEEFVVLLPQEELEGAETVAARMLEAVRALGMPHGGSSCADHVTISLGAASMVPPRGSSRLELIAAADALLYQAKTAGRDRCCAVRCKEGTE